MADLVRYEKDGFIVKLEPGSIGEDRAVKNGFTLSEPSELPPSPEPKTKPAGEIA